MSLQDAKFYEKASKKKSFYIENTLEPTEHVAITLVCSITI